MNIFNKMDRVEFLRESNEASDYIEKLKLLENKASGDIKSKIEKEIKICTWGMLGEKNIAFELRNSGIPMYVLHDVNIEIEDLTAQIDYIVVTRKLNFIIECKNLIGDIEIDNNGNFLRKYTFKGKQIKEGIYSPITQNQRHLEVLKKVKKDSFNDNFLFKMGIDKTFDLFNKSIVVLSNPKTILNAKYAKKDVKDQVIRADQLIKHMKFHINQSKEFASSDKQMLSIANDFLNLHNQSKSSFEKRYQEFASAVGVDYAQDFGIDNITTDTSINKSANSAYLSNSGYNNFFDNAVEENLNDIEPKQELENKTIDMDKLRAELKEMRLKTSRKENIKPYFIFNDKQMDDLIDKYPKSKEALIKVSGFGEKKAEKYGEEILSILAKFDCN